MILTAIQLYLILWLHAMQIVDKFSTYEHESIKIIIMHFLHIINVMTRGQVIRNSVMRRITSFIHCSVDACSNIMAVSNLLSSLSLSLSFFSYFQLITCLPVYFYKKDTLREMEKEPHAKWQREETFEIYAPSVSILYLSYLIYILSLQVAVKGAQFDHNN